MKNAKLFFLLSTFTLLLISCNNKIPRTNNTSLGAVHGLSNLVDGDTDIETIENYENSDLEEAELDYDDYAGSFLIEKDIFQSVYSSQNYGTFYQIFCKAHFYEKTANEEYLESLEFKLINFKGPFDLGFSENENQKSELKYKDSIIGLKVVVRGGSPKQSLIINVKDENIKKGEVKALNIGRILIPLMDKKWAISQYGIFDSEFFTRSGIGTTLEKKLVPGLDGYPSDSLGGFKMDELTSENPIQVFGDSKNCYSSFIVVGWE